MLGTRIRDGIESATPAADGLGLLPVATRFAAGKRLRRPSGYAGTFPVTGYEIHHGAVTVSGGEPWFTSEPGGGEPLDGCRLGPVSGTLWHGIFENDAFRRGYLAEVARLAGRDFAPAPDTDFGQARRAQFDTLADAVERHLDTAVLLRLIEQGPAPGLAVLSPGAGEPAP
jgi:adenosylcobyric acid synthase